MGMLNFGFALWLSAFVMIGSVFGLLKMNAFIQKSGRASILVVLLAAIMGIATIVMPLSGALRIVENSQKGYNIWQFDTACRQVLLQLIFRSLQAR